mmetsp:Transcript_7022/g.21989  ORF Transcript_7022/g.21989 Transcript_7022/m.21989 type:complete len:92 (+) Transcript_7022:867-1142(+)
MHVHAHDAPSVDGFATEMPRGPHDTATLLQLSPQVGYPTWWALHWSQRVPVKAGKHVHKHVDPGPGATATALPLQLATASSHASRQFGKPL